MVNVLYSIIIYPLTQIIEFVFCFCNKIFQSIPMALIGVSVAVTLLCLPLYIVAENWQEEERKIQERLSARVKRIKETFKGDEQYMMLGEYYKQNHYHPLMALRSSFSILIQIPFFMAAYSFLSNCPDLQGKAFLFIRDMGEPDSLFKIGNFSVNVLPIAMTLINCVSGIIYSKGHPIREKVQIFGMAAIFLVILYGSPAGLVVYWTMNNILSLVKNIFYKFKHPIKVLYVLTCVLVSVLILFLIFGHTLSAKRGILVGAFFSLLYFSPLFVRFFNFLCDKILVEIKVDSKKRHFLFFTSSISFSLLLGLLIPSLLIASSPIEFSGIDGYASPMFFLWNTFFQAIGLCFVWPVLIYFLYKEKIQSLLAFFFFSGLVGAVANVFVFHGNYGTLSTLLKFTDIPNVDSSLASILGNFFALFLVFAVVVAVLKLPLKKVSVSTVYFYVALLVSIGFLASTVKNVSDIKKGYADYERLLSSSGGSAKTIEPIFHFSRTGKNVLLIFLDKAQNRYIEPLLNADEKLADEFSGFTLYKNTISFSGHTLMGSPACYGGYEYTPEAMNERKDETLVKKHNESILVLPRIFSEQAKDYSATVTDMQWANYSWIPDLSIFDDYPKISAHTTDGKYLDYWYKNHSDLAKLTVTSDTLKRNILWYAIFRVSPLVLRPAFYNDGNYWSSNSKNSEYDKYLSGYSVLEYLPRLTDFDSETENTFISISSEATHQGIFLQAPEFVPSMTVDNSDFSEQFGEKNLENDDFCSMAGALKRIGEWLEFLKKEGVYDNTRIILYSDHGGSGKNENFEWNEKFSELNAGRYNCLLMMKDFGETGVLKVNEDFMTNADVPVLATENLGFEAKNPFTEKNIDSKGKENGALVCTDDIFMPFHTKSPNVFTAQKGSWYRVKGNIFNSENWIEE